MRLRDNIFLYPVGHEFAVIDPGKNWKQESYIYPMNECCALLWNTFQRREFTAEDMADVLCQHYDVSREVAMADVHQMLQEWENYELLA